MEVENGRDRSHEKVTEWMAFPGQEWLDSLHGFIPARCARCGSENVSLERATTNSRLEKESGDIVGPLALVLKCRDCHIASLTGATVMSNENTLEILEASRASRDLLEELAKCTGIEEPVFVSTSRLPIYVDNSR